MATAGQRTLFRQHIHNNPNYLRANIRHAACPRQGIAYPLAQQWKLWRMLVRIRNAFVRGSAAAFLSAWLVAPAAAQTARPDSTAPTPIDRSRIRIDNFGEVSPVFYRGAQPKGRDYADLAALGVK